MNKKGTWMPFGWEERGCRPVVMDTKIYDFMF